MAKGETTSEMVKTIVMARKLAGQWIDEHSREEYRFNIMASPRYFGGILRSFRDGRLKLSKVLPLPDLGVEEMSESVQVWSSDRDGLKSLERYFAKIGVETSWIW